MCSGEDQQVGRKLNSQTVETTSTVNCKTHTGNDYRSDGMGITNNPNMSNYFGSSANRGAGKEANRLITQQIHSIFSDAFTGIGCFEGTFKLWVRESSQQYQAPPQRVDYALQ